MAKLFETNRLILRHWEKEDAEQLFEICGNADVMAYVGDGKPFENMERTEKFLDWVQKYQKENGFCRWAVIEKDSEKIVGSCGFARLENGEIDFGYLFAKDTWGKSYATEAGLKCVKYGLNKLKFAKIVAMVDVENMPSKRVLEKIGFKSPRIERTEIGEDLIYEMKNQDINAL